MISKELEAQYAQEEKEWQERQMKLGIITYKKQRKAMKSHFCEKCGCEIHKGEYVWWYKPYPVNGQWFKWRTRCQEHEPMKYNEDTFNKEVSESTYEDNGYGEW